MYHYFICMLPDFGDLSHCNQNNFTGAPNPRRDMNRRPETLHLPPDAIPHCVWPSRRSDNARPGLTMEEGVPAPIRQTQVANHSVREAKA
jgi:hypothetical protein